MAEPEAFARSVQHLQPLGTLVLRSADGKVLASSGDLQGVQGEKVRITPELLARLKRLS